MNNTDHSKAGATRPLIVFPGGGVNMCTYAPFSLARALSSLYFSSSLLFLSFISLSLSFSLYLSLSLSLFSLLSLSLIPFRSLTRSPSLSLSCIHMEYEVSLPSRSSCSRCVHVCVHTYIHTHTETPPLPPTHTLVRARARTHTHRHTHIQKLAISLTFADTHAHEADIFLVAGWCCESTSGMLRS